MKKFDFYIVPTPIGNLSDITERALEVLRTVDVIACEDSRNTKVLTDYYKIPTRLISYHKFNEKERCAMFLELLREGKKIALVSDAGTPLFCDPGAIIAEELKKEGFTVTALPGANALVTFLSQIPRKSEEFVFLGFLPRGKSQISDTIEKYNFVDTVFYESPNRLMTTLEVVAQVAPGKKISVGRELTKLFEEVLTDSVENLIEYFSRNILKGELVVILHSSERKNGVETYLPQIEALKNKNFSTKDISVIIATLYDVNKNEVYTYLNGLNRD